MIFNRMTTLGYNADGSVIDTTPIAVAVKAFTFKNETASEHSFYMGVDTGGLTHTIEVVHVPPTTTLHELRPLIESKMDRHMCRRSPLYEELLDIFRGATNPYNLVAMERFNRYTFGLLQPQRAVEDLIEEARATAKAENLSKIEASDLEWKARHKGKYTTASTPDILMIPYAEERTFCCKELPLNSDRILTVIVVPLSQSDPAKRAARHLLEQPPEAEEEVEVSSDDESPLRYPIRAATEGVEEEEAR